MGPRQARCERLVPGSAPASPSWSPATWSMVGHMSTLGPEDLVGRTAYVRTAIPGGQEPGEVVIRIRGGSEAFIAYADDPVPHGAEVVVVADRGARSVAVAPL